MRKSTDLSYSELVALLATRQAERAAAIIRVNAVMAEYDINVNELGVKKARKPVQVTLEPKGKQKGRKYRSTAAQRAKWNAAAAKRRLKATTLKVAAA